MTNIADILEAQLDAVSLRQLRLVADAAQVDGVQAYLVGGAVRDALLGLPVGDMDIVVVGLTAEFARIAAAALDARIAKHSQFNTFALDIDGKRIDIAKARRETYARPGALPTVSPADSIQDDLARRDFSVNAMAVSLNAGSFGELLDPLGGRGDLRRRLVRVMHDGSFRDDATRILRAARYVVRLGFSLEVETERQMMHDAAYLDAISGARLRHEFVRVLQEGRAVSTLDMLHRLGVLQAIHPALTLGDRVLAALNRAADSDYGDKPALLLSVLAYGMTADDRDAFADRLRMTSNWRRILDDTGLAKSRVQDGSSVGNMPRSEIYLRLRGLDEAAILGCALCADGTSAGRRLMLYLDELRCIKPILNGEDLLALGVPQGPRIGELLDELLEARLDGQVETRRDEMNFVRARLSCISC